MNREFSCLAYIQKRYDGRCFCFFHSFQTIDHSIHGTLTCCYRPQYKILVCMCKISIPTIQDRIFLCFRGIECISSLLFSYLSFFLSLDFNELNLEQSRTLIRVRAHIRKTDHGHSSQTLAPIPLASTIHASQCITLWSCVRAATLY